MSTKSDKYIARRVEENGTDRVGVVLNAWDLPEGVVGLYVKVHGVGWESWRDGVKSDSEHWTIASDCRTEQEKLNDGVRVVSERLGRLIFGD